MARTKGKFKEHQKRQATAEYYHIEEKSLSWLGISLQRKAIP